MVTVHPPIILFDFDGVILNSRGHLLAAMEALTDPKNRWDSLVANTTTALEIIRLFEISVKARNIPTIKSMSKNFMELIPNRLMRVIFFYRYGKRVNELEWIYSDFIQGAEETLRKLDAKGIKMGSVTSSYGYRINKWAEIKSISHILKHHISRDERKIYGAKPDPRPLYGVIMKMKRAHNWGKINLNRVAFVGDNLTDILAAKRAGVKSIAVLSGHAYKSELEMLNPDFILNDVTEIPQILKKIFPQRFSP